MMTLYVRNVEEALPAGLLSLVMEGGGVERPSRAGPVLEYPGPVATVYHNPWERVLFEPKRDANPFFHLMEFIWMMAGRNDVGWLIQFNSRMKEFSDEGVLKGAYGHRWTKHFGLDQIGRVIERLKKDPHDRRSYVGMYDPTVDTLDHRDIPCNVGIHFYVRPDPTPDSTSLTMTVFNRSNDIVWGAYGANVVHMSLLQQLVAESIHETMGDYVQVSSSYHAYRERPDVRRLLGDPGFLHGKERPRVYDCGAAEAQALLTGDETYEQFILDAKLFTEDPMSYGMTTEFFRRTVTPIYSAFLTWKKYPKDERLEPTMDLLERCKSSDWRLGCMDWVCRRAKPEALPPSQAACLQRKPVP